VDSEIEGTADESPHAKLVYVVRHNGTVRQSFDVADSEGHRNIEGKGESTWTGWIRDCKACRRRAIQRHERE
jgi:hypothetical protein